MCYITTAKYSACSTTDRGLHMEEIFSSAINNRFSRKRFRNNNTVANCTRKKASIREGRLYMKPASKLLFLLRKIVWVRIAVLWKGQQYKSLCWELIAWLLVNNGNCNMKERENPLAFKRNLHDYGKQKNRFFL